VRGAARWAALALLAGGLGGAAGCGSSGDATVDGVLLAQADGVGEAPEGATLAVDENTIAGAAVPPGAKVVRLAIGRKATWSQVQELVRKVQAAGARPVLLAGNWNKVKSFRIEDPWPGGERAIHVTAYIDGKACIQPPGSPQAKCVQSGTKKYIERAYVRELVREQVTLFDLPLVDVDLPSSLKWDDVVRTIDGARTCCEGTEVRVRLRHPEPPRPAEPTEPTEPAEPAEAAKPAEPK
jgi:hypothetical protein